MKCSARAVETESTHDSSKAQHAAVEEEKAGLSRVEKLFAIVHVDPKTARYVI